MNRRQVIGASAAVLLMPYQVLAWGAEGHEVVAQIARDELTPRARGWVDSLLSEDHDTLTAPDMLSRSTWADAWRAAGHRETASWHFVDLELDRPDLSSACFGFPKGPNAASAGPAEDCVVNKLDEFTAELANRSTPEPERLLALKYVLHFVGDLHQPLHSSDNHDRGGNCVMVGLGGPRSLNFHAYWDTAVLAPLGRDPEAVARTLEGEINAADRKTWSRGTPADWARENYSLAKTAVYTIGSLPGCGGASPISLSAAYQARATALAKIQLEKAGVRLAAVLNQAAAAASR